MGTVQDISANDLGPVGEDDLTQGSETPPETGEGERRSSALWKYPAALYRFVVKKPVFLALAALLIGAAAAWGFLESPAWKRGSDTRGRPVSLKDSLHQEELSRFYIPMPEDSPTLVMVVDCSVVWDALSAVRFKKAEVSIRNRVYDSLSSLAAKEEGLQENITILEEAIANPLRETLRTGALSVKVREVKVF